MKKINYALRASNYSYSGMFRQREQFMLGKSNNNMLLQAVSFQTVKFIQKIFRTFQYYISGKILKSGERYCSQENMLDKIILSAIKSIN